MGGKLARPLGAHLCQATGSGLAEEPKSTRRASTVSTAVHKIGGSSSVGGQGASPGEWCMSSGGGRKCWVETQQHQLLCFPCGKDTCLRRFLAQY